MPFEPTPELAEAMKIAQRISAEVEIQEEYLSSVGHAERFARNYEYCTLPDKKEILDAYMRGLSESKTRMEDKLLLLRLHVKPPTKEEATAFVERHYQELLKNLSEG